MGSAQHVVHAGVCVLAVAAQPADLAGAALPAVLLVLNAVYWSLPALHAVPALLAEHAACAAPAVGDADPAFLGLRFEPAFLGMHAEPAVPALLALQEGPAVPAVHLGHSPGHAH